MTRKNFKDNPAMKFINRPRSQLESIDNGGAARSLPAEPVGAPNSGPSNPGISRINLAFSPDDFQYLQTIARQDGLSMTEYLNRLISADRKDRMDELKRT
ncbi:MAG: hypothetical protein GX133_05765 [Syntrophomonadaceae bacterium]|nr:hypothetical protein [Syntrophomonadaceae bacterium]